MKMASRPDYTGRWEFDEEASALQIAVPDSVVFEIQHREPFFRLERSFVIGGRADTFSIRLEVGGENAPVRRGDATLYPEARWEDERLVFRTRVVREGEEAYNVVRYRLEGNGDVLVAEESFRGPKVSYDNRWVFTRTGRRKSDRGR